MRLLYGTLAVLLALALALSWAPEPQVDTMPFPSAGDLTYAP
jgi:hypothetical protein